MYSKKSLGQNFLKNPQIVDKIIGAAEIEPSDFIIEIGPGTGILTEALVKTGAKILAIEKDFNLSTKLQKLYKNAKNLKVSHQDILRLDPEILQKSYKVVANIPYYISSPIIRKFLETKNKPQLMVLMVQKEVAERITAQPGNAERGLLTLIIEYYADAEIIAKVPKTDFYPVPKVDSAVVKITPYHKKSHPRGGVEQVEPKIFFQIVKAGFSSKRQQIHNALAATLRLPKDNIKEILEKSKIDLKLRAEDLTLEQWFELAKNFEEIF